MSSELSTFLIEDPRISRITSDIQVAVKDGPASCVVQGYPTNSNSSSTTLFNVNVPSENTLVDRNLRVQGTIQCVMELTVGANAVPLAELQIIPSAFPLNQALQSASLTLNNAKVTVQSSDILNIITKQYHQRFLSKHIQTTPSMVDKYYAKAVDAMDNNKPSAWGAGVDNGEKDSDTVGRADSAISYVVYTGAGAVVAGGNLTADTTYYVEITLEVNEPILGMPTLEFKEDESSYLGINNLELVLQYNDFKNVFNVNKELVMSFASGKKFGAQASTLFLKDDARLMARYISLHPSQYAKLNAKNILPFDEFIAYKTTLTLPADGQGVDNAMTNVISMRQVPDKIFIVVRPQYRSQKAYWSNNLCYPINQVNVTFNNKAGLLSEMDAFSLYQMSRRNGSQQTWNEFRGVVRNGNGTTYTSLGSIIVIDPCRDLGLSDMLSSSSLGQFGFQALVSCNQITGIANSVVGNIELCVLASYGGVMITERGSSATMSGLLTKTSVLEAKEKGTSSIDYEDVESLSGGNLMKKGITSLGDVIQRNRGSIAKAIRKGADVVGGAKSSYSTSGGSKLSKYM
jgi:hypothetical protein